MIKKSRKTSLNSSEDVPNKKIKLEKSVEFNEISNGKLKTEKGLKTKTFSKPDKIKKLKKANESSEVTVSKKKLGGKGALPITNTGVKQIKKEKSSTTTVSKKFPKNTKDGVKPNKLKENVKTDWNEFKKKKKELQLKRKQSNKLYDVTVQVKQIGEKLRNKTLKGGEAERSKLCSELHELIGHQGNYPKLALAHDTARVIQNLLKSGSAKIRQEVAKELIPETVQMLNSKYAKNCVKAMLKYGDSTIRSPIIQSFYGSVVKLCSHVLSAQIFEYAYSTFASAQEKQYMAQEFYGDIYKQSKEKDVHHLKDVYEKSPDMKAAALGATKANLMSILNKELLDNALVHTVLYQYMLECSTENKGELITQLASHVVILSNSKDGVRAAMQCFSCGTNKDRKIAIKALKEHVVELANHEHGHNLIIALLDTTDDTVVINKIILTELLASVQQVAQDDWGRKVLLWLLAPANSKYFHPTFLAELEIARKLSTSKKDAAIRQKELLNYMSDPLLDDVTSDANFWLHDVSVAIVTLNIVSTGEGDKLSSALNSLATVVTQQDWKIDEKVKKSETETKTTPGIEHAGLHMVLKNLAKNDKNATAKGLDTFGSAVFEHLSNDAVEIWISSNRGCFLLVNIFENNSEQLQEKMKEALRPHAKKLKKSASAGAKLLCKKLEL